MRTNYDQPLMIKVILAIVTFTVFNGAIANDSDSNETTVNNCAELTWPDGHKTIIGSYRENEAFYVACREQPGLCMINESPYPSSDRDAALAEAGVECVLGPDPTILPK